jgi:hypothetical protein
MDSYELKANDPTGKSFAPLQAPSKEGARKAFEQYEKLKLEFAGECEMGDYTLTNTTAGGEWQVLSLQSSDKSSLASSSRH